jgi:hypothetical protein
VPLDAVAVRFPAQEDHLESVASAEMAPACSRGEIDQLERHRLTAVDARPALGVSAANEDEVLGSRRAIEAEE